MSPFRGLFRGLLRVLPDAFTLPRSTCRLAAGALCIGARHNTDFEFFHLPCGLGSALQTDLVPGTVMQGFRLNTIKHLKQILTDTGFPNKLQCAPVDAGRERRTESSPASKKDIQDNRCRRGRLRGRR